MDKLMTLDDAIEHCREKAYLHNQCAAEHAQLGDWLAELKSRRAGEPADAALENGFEITNADGTPVDYDYLKEKYKVDLCCGDPSGFYVGQDGSLALVDDDGRAMPVDRGDYHIAVRRPEAAP